MHVHESFLEHEFHESHELGGTLRGVPRENNSYWSNWLLDACLSKAAQPFAIISVIR